MNDVGNDKINLQALFSDETEDFRIPPEADAGESVTLRFRTAVGDVDAVYYVETGAVRRPMQKVASDTLFDYYEYTVTVPQTKLQYCFYVEKGEEYCFYNRQGVVWEENEQFDFRITPGFRVPHWAKGAVMYQIFVDRFCDGDKTNNVETQEYVYIDKPVQRVDDWTRNPASMDVGCFYGGDLQGVWDKLDYLQSLGVDVIYFNPLFVSPSNHKYDTQDYDHIDPHFGKIVKDEGSLVAKRAKDNAKAGRYVTRTTDSQNLEASDRLFADFMAEVHRRGMKVIMDGVFNHCGSFNKWMDRERIYEHCAGYAPGAYVSEESPYRTFFEFKNKNGWPYNKDYTGWWNHNTLPKLNYEDSPKLQEYIMGIARKWIAPPYAVDGWRLDVAADLGHTPEYNHRFWKEFRKHVKEVNPNALILAEHYGDPWEWLQGDQWDTIMNYDAFMEPVSWFMTGMEKHSDEFRPELFGDGEAFFAAMNYHMSRMQTSSIMTSMNELSNHDHSRFMTRTNQTVGRIGTVGPELAEQNVQPGLYRAAVLIQMTWPGCPTLYYGDETGVCGWTDPDNRRTYPWGKEDQMMIEFHRYMIGLHKRNRALKRGSLKKLLVGKHMIAYGRFSGENRAVAAVNSGSGSLQLEIPVWQIGITDQDVVTREMLTSPKGYNVGCIDYPVKDGMLQVTLETQSGVLFISNKIHHNVSKIE